MKLPNRYAPFLYGIVQAALTTAIASAVTAARHNGFSTSFFAEWLPAWGIAWLLMLPVVILLSPIIQRAVAACVQDQTSGVAPARS